MKALYTMALLAVACGGSSPPAEWRECSAAGGASEAELRALYSREHSPIVVLGSSSYVCGCGGRTLAGAGESRALAGAEQDRQLAGSEQDRSLAGDEEARRLAGTEQDRRLASDEEARRLAGAEQDRRLAGAEQDRGLAGAAEARRLDGAQQDRGLAGAEEARRLAGGEQDRRLAGDASTGSAGGLRCTVEPSCNGFRVGGVQGVRYFDGIRVRDATDGCID